MIENLIELAKSGLSGIAIFSIALNFYMVREFLKAQRAIVDLEKNHMKNLIDVIQKNTEMFGVVKESITWCKNFNRK